MALVNAKGEFIFVDVGKNGRLSDGGVIEYTRFYEKLKNNALNLPDNVENEYGLNSIFIGDEAFALHKHILKPFPQRDLTYNRRIFNYRLSRGRNIVENSFGLIASIFRILHTAISVRPEKINYIVLAICVLHNYLLKKSSRYASGTAYDKDRTELLEINRCQNECDLTALSLNNNRNVCLEAKENREKYLEYFNGVGKVDFQDDMLKKGKA